MPKRLLPPSFTNRALMSSMTPVSVSVPMTTNRLMRSRSVSKSISPSAYLMGPKCFFWRMERTSPMRNSVMQIRPFVMAGRPGMKDAVMSSTTVPTSRYVGNRSSTTVGAPTVTLPFSLRKMNMMTGTVTSAPSSTAKKMEHLPSMKMKSKKSMLA